jgi:hypothetical protein
VSITRWSTAWRFAKNGVSRQSDEAWALAQNADCVVADVDRRPQPRRQADVVPQVCHVPVEGGSVGYDAKRVVVNPQPAGQRGVGASTTLLYAAFNSATLAKLPRIQSL